MKTISAIGLGALVLVGTITLGSQPVAARDGSTNQSHKTNTKPHHKKHHKHHGKHHGGNKAAWSKKSY